VLAHCDLLAVGSLVGLADDPFVRLPVWQSIVKTETHPMLDEAHFRDNIQHDAAMLETIRRSRGVVVWTSNEAADRLAMLRVVAALDGIDDRVFEIDVTPSSAGITVAFARLASQRTSNSKRPWAGCGTSMRTSGRSRFRGGDGVTRPRLSRGRATAE
jgi:hypothetical protein